jgi:hypothetical protein
VADALSRKEVGEENDAILATEVACVEALTELSDILKQKIIKGYTEDQFCISLKKVLLLQENCFEKEDLLFIDGHLLILKDLELCRILVKDAHERLGHLGYLKTAMELRHEFFWPGLAKDVHLYV